MKATDYFKQKVESGEMSTEQALHQTNVICSSNIF